MRAKSCGVALVSTCLILSASGVAAQQDPTSSNDPCADPSRGSGQIEIFDAHAHIMTRVTSAQIIAQMDAAGVSMLNLYPVGGDGDTTSLAAMDQYPGRFVTFVATPDSPRPSTWLTEGQAFVRNAEARLSSEAFLGIGETNLRYFQGPNFRPIPDIYVSPDSPIWLQLVDLSARHHVPISFHFVPEDPASTAVFEKMLSSNPDATFIWAHLGFDERPIDSAFLTDFLLRYPNLYFDTAGLQNMRLDPPGLNSNWWTLANRSSGQMSSEWKEFFETWSSRVLFGSDAGGGSNGLERWLNYSSNETTNAPGNAIGQWRRLLSNLEPNAARNIFNTNAKRVILKEPAPAYNFSVAAGGECSTVLVNSNSSISALAFDPNTQAISFRAAGADATTGQALVTVPTALVVGDFSASVDGQTVESLMTTDGAFTAIELEYPGGIRSITLATRE